MSKELRSRCPVNMSVEIFGDRWTLLVLRDIVYANARHFRELLAGPEGISSAVLADRLESLVTNGMLTRSDDSAHKQKITYSLTERAIQLVPILIQISDWGVRHLPVSPEYAARNQVLIDGGAALCETFMDDLRELHLGAGARRRPAPAGPSVVERVMTAYHDGPRDSPGPTFPSGY